MVWPSPSPPSPHVQHWPGRMTCARSMSTIRSGQTQWNELFGQFFSRVPAGPPDGTQSHANPNLGRSELKKTEQSGTLDAKCSQLVWGLLSALVPATGSEQHKCLWQCLLEGGTDDDASKKHTCTSQKQMRTFLYCYLLCSLKSVEAHKQPPKKICKQLLQINECFFLGGRRTVGKEIFSPKNDLFWGHIWRLLWSPKPMRFRVGLGLIKTGQHAGNITQPLEN